MEKAEGGARLGGRRVPEGHSGAQERLAGDASEPRPPQQVELDRFCSLEPRPSRCCGALQAKGAQVRGGAGLEPNLSRAPRLGRLPASARASVMALLPESGRALGPAGIVRSAPPAGSRGFDVAAPALVLRCCVHAVGLPHADRCIRG